MNQYVHDPEALAEEIKQANRELANPASSQRGVISYTTKHCYHEINDELQFLKERRRCSCISNDSKKGFFDNQGDNHVF